MAILEKIRNRTVFLIAIIGLALFAFVISDFIGSGRFGNWQTTEIGTVNGEDVSIDAFRFQVENAVQGAGGQASSLEAAKYVWEQNVRSILLKQQFEKLGLSIEKDQILSVLAKSPLAQSPEFTNDLGVFDPSKFISYLATLKASNPQAYQEWKMQENALVETAKQQMYFNLIRAGLGVTNAEAEIAYHQEQDKADIKFVALQYSSIPDSTVSVSDSDIKAYISKNKKQFEQEAFRNIQYIVVNEKASAEDIEADKASLLRLLEPQVVYNSTTNSNDTIGGFANVKNIREFIEKNSDSPYDSLYVTKSELPTVYADTLFALPVGKTFGPYDDNGVLKLSRMVAKETNGAVKASHILIAYAGSRAANENTTRTKEEALAKANEILAKARKEGADFAELARENSEEPGANYSGGDLGFFTRGRMVKPFEDFVFTNKVGHIGVVETDFGFHVVRVTEKANAVQIATITRNIEPSETTLNDLFTKVSKFEMDALADVKNFGEVAKKSDLTVLRADNLKQNDEYIIGLGNNRQIVQWLFQEDTKVGDIRKFTAGGSYIVAQLTKKGEKGVSSVQDAAPFVKPILIREKKAQILAEKAKGASLDAIASANNAEVRTATGLSMNNPTIIGEGREPKVVGTVFALKQGQTSKPIEGENAVYVVEVTAISPAQAPSDLNSQRKSLETLKVSRASQEVYNALKNAAEIKENLSSFY